MAMKTYKLSNGMEIPAIGFGCYDPDGEDSRAMFRTAMEVGYRYFDTFNVPVQYSFGYGLSYTDFEIKMI